jgi:hypothetical protein
MSLGLQQYACAAIHASDLITPQKEKDNRNLGDQVTHGVSWQAQAPSLCFSFFSPHGQRCVRREEKRKPLRGQRLAITFSL